MPRKKKEAPAPKKAAAKKAAPKKAAGSRLDQLKLLTIEVNTALGKEGKGKVYLGSEHPPVERYSSGILALDMILGGGLPRGLMVEFYGQQSHGKTLAAMISAASVQEDGGSVVWLKGEEFDSAWAEKQGVRPSDLVMIDAATGDTALEAGMSMVETSLVDLMVIDSFQALGTERESEGGIDSESYAGAGAPQMWGRVMRRAYAAANQGKTRAAIIGISQVRTKIGGFSPNGAPEPEPSAIRAILHWKSISIQFKSGEIKWIGNEEKKRKGAQQFHLKCKKNKTAPTEHRASSFWYYFHPMKDDDGNVIPVGIDKVEQAFRLGKLYGLIEGSSWFEGYGIKAQGGPAFMKKLRAQPETVKELSTDILYAVSQEGAK